MALERAAPAQQAVAGAVDPRRIVHVDDARRGEGVSRRTRRRRPSGPAATSARPRCRCSGTRRIRRGPRGRPRCCRRQSRGSPPARPAAPRESARARTPPSRPSSRCRRGWSRRRRPAGRPRPSRQAVRCCRPFQLTMMTRLRARSWLRALGSGLGRSGDRRLETGDFIESPYEPAHGPLHAGAHLADAHLDAAVDRGAAEHHFVHARGGARTSARSSMVPRTGTPAIQRCAFAGSSSMKPIGFMLQCGLARISRTSSWPNAPAP